MWRFILLSLMLAGRVTLGEVAPAADEPPVVEENPFVEAADNFFDGQDAVGAANVFKLNPGTDSKVFFVALADVFDPNFGDAAKANLTLVRTWFSTVFDDRAFPKWQGRGQFFEIGSRSKPTNNDLLTLFEGFKRKLAPADTLVFYYCGAGKFDAVRHQTLKLSGSRSPVAAHLVHRLMVETGAGNVVLIYDVPSKRDDAIAFGPIPAVDGNEWPLVGELLFNTSGTTQMVGAVPPGTQWAGKGGSLLTREMIRAFHQPLDAFKDAAPTGIHWMNFTTEMAREMAPAKQSAFLLSMSRPGRRNRPETSDFAPAQLTNPTLRHGVAEEGVSGFRVSTKLTVKKRVLQPVTVSVHVTDAQGRPLADKDGKFRTDLGKVAAGKVVKPEEDGAEIPVEIFLPYSQMDGVDQKVSGQRFQPVLNVLDRDGVLLERWSALPFRTR